mgnify:FL=1
MTTPELTVSQWFNTDQDINLAGLAGQVVVIEAFQMLCPGCVFHGLQKTFASDAVTVLGLHTEFEHHAAMTPVSLAAFLHEYRITFPVGVDAAGTGSLPKTMEAFRLRGTPSMLLIDKAGALRANHFGEVNELRLGAEIATLLNEKSTDRTTSD